EKAEEAERERRGPGADMRRWRTRECGLGDVGRRTDEVVHRRGEEADRAEHCPTRTPCHVPGEDEAERRDRDARPLPVAGVSPVEDRAADQHAAHEMEPER